MDRKKLVSIFNIETIIILIITACVLFLNTFAANKMYELERVGTEAMFVADGLNYSNSEQLGNEIVKYRPDSYKMIEIYNESFELLFSLQFDENRKIYNNNIYDHEELLYLLNNTDKGQTLITVGDYKEQVYFEWMTNNKNEKRLVIVYSTKEIVNNIWMFSFICYIILILIFILLIRLHTKNYNDKIYQYKMVSYNFRDEVNRK